ncbi:MAG: hypothetical protein AMJ78_09480 [Omnitrophica WOR_2 bacterium SM23_29]|nr:MAG: hypothetical protein AMJ78_09480 [Omnitrophica WOR_2 bacterium SM23_29]
MGKALLIIGDRKINSRKLAPSFNTFVKNVKKFKKGDLEIWVINYKDVLTDNLPPIFSPVLNVMLFFPYEYWNKNIEVYKKDQRIYGDKKFGQEYEKFFERIEKVIRKRYRNKKIKYINPPKSSVLERDKKRSKNLFIKNDIPTPKVFNIRELKDIQRLIAQGTSLYIKPRFGAMGKGITYLKSDLMVTNFLFRKGKIISRPYDYNWRFSKIKEGDRNKLLKILISRGFICEEAIEPPIARGRRFDFRVYCIYGKIPYYYIKTMPGASPVTNWAQGGRIEKRKNFSKYISKAKIKMVKSLTRKVAKKLNLNYAGVDIIFSKDLRNVYVLEGHSFPGFEKRFNLMSYLARKVCTML